MGHAGLPAGDFLSRQEGISGDVGWCHSSARQHGLYFPVLVTLWSAVSCGTGCALWHLCLLVEAGCCWNQQVSSKELLHLISYRDGFVSPQGLFLPLPAVSREAAFLCRHILVMHPTLLQQVAEISVLHQGICQYYSQRDIRQLISKDFGRIYRKLDMMSGRKGLTWSFAWLSCFISQQSPKCKISALCCYFWRAYTCTMAWSHPLQVLEKNVASWKKK